MHVQRCFAHKTNCFLTLSLSSSSWLLKWCHIFHFCRESSSQGLSFFFRRKIVRISAHALSIQPKSPVCLLATCSSEWNNIFQNFQKEDNLARYTHIFGNFFPEAFFPFNFALGLSRIFSWMVGITEIQQSREFLKAFPGNFCTICGCFQIFESFGWMESALSHLQLASRLFLKKWASAKFLKRNFFVLSRKLGLFLLAFNCKIDGTRIQLDQIIPKDKNGREKGFLCKATNQLIAIF